MSVSVWKGVFLLCRFSLWCATISLERRGAKGSKDQCHSSMDCQRMLLIQGGSIYSLAG